MAWYDIPPIKITYLYNEDKKKKGVVFSAREFEKLVAKMEDLYDVAAIERIMKKKHKKVYSAEDIKKLIESKSK